MLTLNASGFHYSIPQLSIKLIQEKVVVPSPAPSAPNKKVTIKKIACVKGKTTKVISGSNPRCPSGYKKK
jgi:hypothetical protein